MQHWPFTGRRFWLALLTLVPIGTASRALTITEIMYHPPDGGPNLQFVEVFNDAGTIADLSGWFFSKGIQFQFPDGTFLEGRSYLVVCGDESAIRTRYGITNTIGNFVGNLENHGETVEILDNNGVLQVTVSYKDRGKWTAIPGGTGHTLCLRTPYLDPDDPLSWAPSRELGGTPGAVNVTQSLDATTEEVVIVPPNALWKYKKGTAEFSTPIGAWRGLAYNDVGWLDGQSGIGYGETYLTTQLPDMSGNYISVAFRKTFSLSAAQIVKIDTLFLGLQYDDSFVAYLNGVEIGRTPGWGVPGQDMPFGANHTELHEGDIEETYAIPKSALIAGTNLLAIQVHNQSLSGSSDMVSIPRLYYRRTISAGTAVVINELLSRAPSGRWVELYNPGDDLLELSGYYLSDSAAQLAKFPLPPGTSLTSHQFLLLSEAETGLALSGQEVKLFLSEPDLGQVLDAHVFENPALPDRSGYSDARIPDGGSQWVYSSIPTPGAPNQYQVENEVVINEVMYNPPETRMAAGGPMDIRPGEYIELHNIGQREIHLQGFAFTKGIEFAFPGDAVLPPDGYLVVAQDPAWITATYGIDNVVGPFIGELKNSGESIRLEDPVGNTVDEIKYADGGDWAELADGGGSSLELIDPRQSGAMGSGWEASDESGKSTWTQLVYTTSRPNLGDWDSILLFTPLDAGSFLLDDVEAVNGAINYIPNGGFETGTNPWLLQGSLSHSYRETGESHSGSACLRVIATGEGDNRTNRIVVSTAPTLIIGNYTVRMWVRWLSGGNLILFHGFDNSMARSLWLPVPRDLGTPGRENGATARLREATGSVNLGPVIGGVSQQPVRPSANQPVTVSVSASDADGVESMQLLYRLNERGDDVFTPLPMTGSDGTYTATIPGTANGNKVLFYFEGTDSLGASRRYPVTAPERTLLYMVSGGLNAPLPVYRLSMDEASRRDLESRQLHSDDPVYGSLVFDDSEIYYNVGFHYHGSPWNRPGSPRMFKLDFPADHPFHGVRKMNISRYGSVANEAMAYHTIARSGRPDSPSPACDYRFVRWILNGSDMGNMSQVETVDSSYVSRRFGSGSSLFRANGKITFRYVVNDPIPDPSQWVISRWASLVYQGTDKESYRYNFDLHTRETEDDFSPLIAWLKVMDGTQTPTLATFDTQVRNLVDVDEFLRVEAIRAMNDDWDAVGVGNGQNVYFNYVPAEGRWKLVPWDMDHTFGNPAATTLVPPQGSPDPGVGRLLSRPDLRRIYLQGFQDTLDRTWRKIHDDGRSHLTSYLDPQAAKGIGNVDGVKTFIAQRIPYITSAIGAATTFRVTSVNGRSYTTGDAAVNALSTTIQGTAPILITALLMNDEPLVVPDLSWVTQTTWKVTVPLVAGANAFTFLGFDRDGNLVGSASASIVSTYLWVAPAILTVDPEIGSPAGGTTVTITGSDFHPGAKVAFGAADSTQVAVISDSLITARTPAGNGQVDVKVTNLDAKSAVKTGGFSYIAKFLRGDADHDGSWSINDPMAILNYLFQGGAVGCLKAADANDDGGVDLGDAIRLIVFLYAGGSTLPLPYPTLGSDPTPDSLDCANSP